jgi:cell division protease FtsH
MAQKVDAEVNRIIGEQYERAKSILYERRAAVEKIAAALIEFETLEGKHVLEILEHGEIRSPILKPIPPEAPGNDKVKKPRDKETKAKKDLPHGAEPTGAPA